MSQGETSRKSCLLVWAILVLIPLVLVGAILFPWFAKLSSLDETIASGEDRLGRYQRLIATLPVLKAELEQVQNDGALESYYFSAPTPALAGALLQSQVQKLVTSAKGRLISIQGLPDDRKETPSRLRVRAQIQGSTDVLLDILYHLEQERPFLFVEQVSVRSSARVTSLSASSRSQLVRRRSVNTAGDLTMRLDVVGFALGGGS